MKKFLVTGLILALMMMAVACGQKTTDDTATDIQTDDTTAPEIAAVVDDTEITQALYEKAFILVKNNYEQSYGEGVMEQEYNGNTVEAMVRSELLQSLVLDVLVREKLNAEGYTVGAEELDEAYAKFDEAVLQADETQKKFYEDNEITEDFIKGRIESQMYATEFSNRIASNLSDSIDLTSEEYADQIATVRAQHILVDTQEEAEDILAKLEAGEDFSELAKTLSKDSGSGELGGDLGYFARTDMIPEFEEAAFALEVGEVSVPVATQYGFHVIKITDKLTYAQALESEEAGTEEATLKQKLVNSQYNEAYEQAMSDLQEGHTITYISEDYIEFSQSESELQTETQSASE